MPKVLLSLGSNLGDSREILKSALKDIRALNTVKDFRVSSFYRTKPVGYADQDDFLNLACTFETELEPLNLLVKLQALEYKYKRVRLFKDGPRTLDIDIIAYGDECSDDERLTLPHPRMQDRAFVLAPLTEIAEDFVVKKFNISIGKLYKKLPDTEKKDVVKLNG